MANKELNLEEKVWVKNLCNWNLYFPRMESIGEVKLPANGRIRLSRAEIQSQVFNNNVMFAGDDGQGSHARIYIEDKPLRVELGFESEDKDEQMVLTEDVAKQIFDYKTQKTFEKHVKEKVKTQAEKAFIMEQAKKQKLNDYEKISFLEEYTGMKLDKSDK